jgi:FKBP-type peptidyl-prolyl cis-trans isomerase
MMRAFVLAIVCLSLCAGTTYAQNDPASDQDAAPDAAVDSKDAAEIASYGIGMRTGRSIKTDGVGIDLDAFVQGIRDGAEAAKPKYTEEQILAAIEIFKKSVQAKKEQGQQAIGEKNKAEGKAFLAKNKAKDGVKSRPSGLQYEVLKSGKGTSPKATDTVKVHYEGTLLDGTVFDSSIERNEPAVFPVNRVIPGWTEAMQLMKVGDKWRLVVPSELAYGERGAGGDIGPNAVLVFEVELLGIESSAAKDSQPEEDSDK